MFIQQESFTRAIAQNVQSSRLIKQEIHEKDRDYFQSKK